MFDRKCNSVRKLWDNLNTVCSFNNKNRKSSIDAIMSNNCKVTDTLDICNALNEYFSTVGPKLVEDLHNANQGINKCDFKEFCDKSIVHTMFINPVDATELLQLIKYLKNGKSPGPDEIGPALVKDVSAIICEPLVHIFNLSLSTGHVPDKLKVAKVIPVFKKGSRELAYIIT